MDANGTRYKLLLGFADWSRCLDGGAVGRVELAAAWASPLPAVEGTGWDADRSELTLAPSPWRFPAPAGERALTLDARRGAAMDRYGNWYWIDDAGGGVLVTSSGTGLTTPFWPPAPGAAPAAGRGSRAATGRFGAVRPPAPVSPGRLGGLDVTEDHYLLVGTLDPGGLLVFDLRSGGAPLHVAWPSDVPFQPCEIAARPGGGAYVLDGPRGGRRAWRLDRHFLVEPLGDGAPAAPAATAFAPLDAPGGEPPGPNPPAPAPRPGAIASSDAIGLPGDPVGLVVLDADTVVVLDRLGDAGGSVVRLFDAAMHELPGSPRELAGLGRPLVAHAMTAVPVAGDRVTGDRVAGPDGAPRVLGDLYVVDTMGDQAYRFPLTAGAAPLAVRSEYNPIRLFGGRGLVRTPRGVWYDCVDRWVPLVAQGRPQYAERATVDTPVLDGAQHDCAWHRVLLDASIPSEAAVRVWSAASNDRAILDAAPRWVPQPAPYRRGDGPERPFPVAPPDPRVGTFELLLQGVRGRYLRLRLELAGNRRTTPRIRALRAYYPRFSYLEQYLPHEYREDETSAGFLDGFLANFEGTLTAIEDRMTTAERLFDARSAPAEALDWLASWFDVVMDPAWDEDRRRLLLRHAVELFRHRGTARGLRMALGLATVACPDDRLFAPDAGTEPGGLRIIERYQTSRGPAALFGDPTAASLPRESSVGSRWSPADGGTALHARYAAYLRRLADRGLAGPPSDTDGRYPVTAPDGARLAAWRAFSGDVLGVVPSAGPADAGRWQAFLARRYLTAAAYVAGHRIQSQAAVTAFDQIGLPASLPPDGAPLADWYAFESIVLRGVRAAHRFSVLLPVPTGGTAAGAALGAVTVRDRRAEQERMARLVELEKPAHTVFDIRSYWLAFRVGEARLGKDTLLDLGSRSPDLRPPAVLGSMHLGEGVLTSAMADVPDRPAAFSGSVDAATRRIARRTDG